MNRMASGVPGPPVPGRDAVPEQVFHFRTLGAAFVAAFVLSVVAPLLPWVSAAVGIWLVGAGFLRLGRPGYARVPLVGWRLPFSGLDGLLWIAVTATPVLLAVATLAVRS